MQTPASDEAWRLENILDRRGMEYRHMILGKQIFNQENRRTNEVQLNDSTSKSFISFVAQSVGALTPKQFGSLVMFFFGILIYLTKTCGAQFKSFEVGKITNTVVEAFYAFIPEEAHITGYIICWIITFILILRLPLELQITFGLLWVCSTIFYFVELVEKTFASRVHVTFGNSFMLPVFWYVTLEAVAFSLFIGLIVSIIVYLSWKYVHRGHPRNAEVTLNRVVSPIELGVNV